MLWHPPLQSPTVKTFLRSNLPAYNSKSITLYKTQLTPVPKASLSWRWLIVSLILTVLETLINKKHSSLSLTFWIATALLPLPRVWMVSLTSTRWHNLLYRSQSLPTFSTRTAIQRILSALLVSRLLYLEKAITFLILLEIPLLKFTTILTMQQ